MNEYKYDTVVHGYFYNSQVFFIKNYSEES